MKPRATPRVTEPTGPFFIPVIMHAVARFGAAIPVVAMTLLLLARTAPAQEHVHPVAQKGTWDISVWAAGATGEEQTDSFTEARIWTAGVFIGRMLTDEIGHGWRRGALEYGFDVAPLFVTSKNQRVHGGGFDPVILRWNFSQHATRLAPYIELGGGGVATTSNLPAGDTSSFNFVTRGGGGIHIFTRDRQSLEVGCRWLHISNANLGVRNPEFNGIQVSLGYHWFK